MQSLDVDRRTALKVLALLGIATTGTGVATADERNDDDYDDGRADPSGVFLARLESQDGVETNAWGVAAVQERQGGLKFVVGVSNLENTVMGHIHEDEALGPIAVWLYDFAMQAERLEEGQFTGILDVGTITDEAIAAGRVPDAESTTVGELLGKIESGEAWVNIHTEAHPSGEIAGRLVPFDPSIVASLADSDDGLKPDDTKTDDDDELPTDDAPAADANETDDGPTDDTDETDDTDDTDDTDY